MNSILRYRNMALIINIESSADFCSVSVFKGLDLLSLKDSNEKHAHSRLLAVLITDCLSEVNLKPSDLDCVGLSAGPGSYTGLRVGASIAKGMCYSLDIPLITIDSLQIIAADFFDIDKDAGIIIPTIDARRQEAYISIFSIKGQILEESVPHIFTPESFSEYTKDNDSLIICGNAANKAKNILLDGQNIDFIQSYPTAKSMGPLVYERFLTETFSDTAYFEPNYIKSPNITTQKKPLIS